MLHGTNLSIELINNDMLKGLNNMEEKEKQIINLMFYNLPLPTHLMTSMMAENRERRKR